MGRVATRVARRDHRADAHQRSLRRGEQVLVGITRAAAAALLVFLGIVGVPTAVGADSSARVATRQAVDVQPKQRLRELRFIDYNLEKKGYGPGWGNRTEPGRALDWAIRIARERQVLGLTLQEVCSDQVDRLRREHPGWTIASTAIRIPVGSACGADRSGAGTVRNHAVMDVAIWTAGAGARVTRYDLAAGDEYSLGTAGRAFGDSMTCVTSSRFGTPMHVCSTHLPVRGNRHVYTARMRHISSPWLNARHLVVIGGDFNLQPSARELDALYAQGPGNGRFYEAGDRQLGYGLCRCGVATTAALDGSVRRKIDYLFVSANRVPVRGKRLIEARAKPPRTNRAEYSDHFMLYARVLVQTER